MYWFCWYNIECLSETHPKPKYREIVFAHNKVLSCAVIVKSRTEHGSIIAVLCAKFQNDRTAKMYIMDEWDFARFEFKIIKGLSYMAAGP